MNLTEQNRAFLKIGEIIEETISRTNLSFDEKETVRIVTTSECTDILLKWEEEDVNTLFLIVQMLTVVLARKEIIKAIWDNKGNAQLVEVSLPTTVLKIQIKEIDYYLFEAHNETQIGRLMRLSGHIEVILQQARGYAEATLLRSRQESFLKQINNILKSVIKANYFLTNAELWNVYQQSRLMAGEQQLAGQDFSISLSNKKIKVKIPIC